MASKMTVTINPNVYKELSYMAELHRQHGAPNRCDNVSDLVAYILSAVADGSRRPGSWERQMLEMMGLVAQCDEHHVYRPNGRPST